MLLRRLNPWTHKRSQRLERFLEIERHEWMDAIEGYRKDHDQKIRQMDLDLHNERRESSNWLENREMRISAIVLEQQRILIEERISLRKRLATECQEMLADSELANLEESMVRSIQLVGSARRDDYERKAHAAGVPMYRRRDRDAAEYGDLEAMVRREIRKLQLDRSLGRIVKPSRMPLRKKVSEWDPTIKLVTGILALLAAAASLYVKFQK